MSALWVLPVHRQAPFLRLSHHYRSDILDRRQGAEPLPASEETNEGLLHGIRRSILIRQYLPESRSTMGP
jgi:hypothetical protein